MAARCFVATEQSSGAAAASGWHATECGKGDWGGGGRPGGGGGGGGGEGGRAAGQVEVSASRHEYGVVMTPPETTTARLAALSTNPTMWSKAEEQNVAANDRSAALKLSAQSLLSWLAKESRMP